MRMTDLEKLKILTGESDEKLLSLLLKEAEAFVLSYTNRTQIAGGLKPDGDGRRERAQRRWRNLQF